MKEFKTANYKKLRKKADYTDSQFLTPDGENRTPPPISTSVDPDKLQCLRCKRMVPNEDEYWDMKGDGSTCNRCAREENQMAEDDYWDRMDSLQNKQHPNDITVKCHQCGSRYNPDSHMQCPSCGG